MASQKTMLASIEAVRELPLPDDCKQLVAKFLRHPTADLIHKLRFYDDGGDWRNNYSLLQIYGDDLPRQPGGVGLGIRQIYCRHNNWSGEPVDCYGELRLQADGRLQCD